MPPDRLRRLSRQVAYALRHKPGRYGLSLDDEGWVGVDALLAALARAKADWTGLTARNLHEMIAASDKKRFEIRDRRIRALYGHSTPRKIEKAPAVPPRQLYHGTTSEALARIRGRLWPWSAVRLLLAKGGVSRVRVLTLGVLPAWRKRGIDAVLMRDFQAAARRHGHSGGD